MNRWLKFLVLAFLLTSCSFFEEDEVPVKVTLKASKDVYEQKKDNITVTATISGKGDQQIFWKLDGNAYKPGSVSNVFDSLELIAKQHIVACSVMVGSKSVVSTMQLKSTTFDLQGPVEKYGRLQVVIGKNLCDKNGEPIQLRGMSTHGLQYFPNFNNENTVKALALFWKADIIRLSSYVNEGWGTNGTYLSNPTYWRTVIDQMIDWAGKYKMYVLIDWHMLTPGDPNINIKEATEFWTYMAEKHGSKEHVLFDICNEPNDDGDETNLPYKVDWDVIKKYADQILPIIRAKSQNVAIVGTPSWASDPSAVIGNTLKYSNVMYTMHFYAGSHGQSYRDNVQRALKAGIPVFVTEFGTQNSDGDGDNNLEESKKWMDFMNANKISWCNWNFSYDFRSGAVFNRTGFDLTKLEHYSDTTKMKEAGKWIYNHIKNRK